MAAKLDPPLNFAVEVRRKAPPTTTDWGDAVQPYNPLADFSGPMACNIRSVPTQELERAASTYGKAVVEVRIQWGAAKLLKLEDRFYQPGTEAFLEIVDIRAPAGLGLQELAVVRCKTWQE